MKKRGNLSVIHSQDPLEDAIYKTVHGFPGGARALAEKCNMRCGVLQNKADPGMPAHRLNLFEGRSVMLATGDYSILDTLATSCGRVVVPIEKYEPKTELGLLDQYLSLEKARGQLADEIHKAIKEKRISSPERKRLRERVMAEMSELEGMLGALEARNDD